MSPHLEVFLSCGGSTVLHLDIEPLQDSLSGWRGSSDRCPQSLNLWGVGWGKGSTYRCPPDAKYKTHYEVLGVIRPMFSRCETLDNLYEKYRE